MSELIHRKGRQDRALCGERVRPCGATLQDDEVTCTLCLRILRSIKDSDTRTRAIARYTCRRDATAC